MSLLRTVTVALVMALVGNVWLVALAPDDDRFANIVGWASLAVAVALAVCYVVAPLRRFVNECYLASLAVWTANLIELWTDDLVSRNTQWRQGGFYSALAVVSLGAYLAATPRRARAG